MLTVSEGRRPWYRLPRDGVHGTGFLELYAAHTAKKGMTRFGQTASYVELLDLWMPWSEAAFVGIAVYHWFMGE